MKVKSKQIINVESYDRQKAEKWLADWVDAWTSVGWTCTEWREVAQCVMSATVECEIEVVDD